MSAVMDKKDFNEFMYKIGLRPIEDVSENEMRHPIRSFLDDGLPQRILKKNDKRFIEKFLKCQASTSKMCKTKAEIQQSSDQMVKLKNLNEKDEGDSQIIPLEEYDTIINSTVAASFDKTDIKKRGLCFSNMIKHDSAYKWCQCEFFDLDVSKNADTFEDTLENYLHEKFQLLKTRQLTRKEWKKIRSFRKKPRRLSQKYLNDEKIVIGLSSPILETNSEVLSNIGTTIDLHATEIKQITISEISESKWIFFPDLLESIVQMKNCINKHLQYVMQLRELSTEFENHKDKEIEIPESYTKKCVDLCISLESIKGQIHHYIRKIHIPSTDLFESGSLPNIEKPSQWREKYQEESEEAVNRLDVKKYATNKISDLITNLTTLLMMGIYVGNSSYTNQSVDMTEMYNSVEQIKNNLHSSNKVMLDQFFQIHRNHIEHKEYNE